VERHSEESLLFALIIRKIKSEIHHLGAMDCGEGLTDDAATIPRVSASSVLLAGARGHACRNIGAQPRLVFQWPVAL
jgi:hypothetical protein